MKKTGFNKFSLQFNLVASHIESLSDINLTAFKEWEVIAKNKLKAEDYPLWHHSCNTYLPEVPDELLPLETTNLPELAFHLVTMSYSPLNPTP